MTTPVLAIPEIAVGQAQKEVTANEAFYRLEQFANFHGKIKDKDLGTPPGSPANGDAYIVPSGATGAWSGQTNKIAFNLNGTWTFVTAFEGLCAYVQDEDILYWYTGTLWTPLRPSTLRSVTAVGNVGTGEDNLISLNLGVSWLYTSTRGVRITAWGTTANNANAKTLKLYFGSAVILTTSLPINVAGVWRIVAEVFSTGTDAQKYVAKLETVDGSGVATIDLEAGTTAQDDGAAINVKCTGEATTNNDIQQQGMLIEAL